MEETEEVEDAGPRVMGIEMGDPSRSGNTWQHNRAEANSRQHNGHVYVYGDYINNGQTFDPATLAAAVARELVDKGALLPLMQQSRPVGTQRRESRDFVSSEGKYRRPQRRPNQQSWKWSITLPPWLASKILRISISRSQAGWDANLRTWNVVPLWSPIFKLAMLGDLPGIQRLVESGQASPFDVFAPGKGIVKIAAASCQPSTTVAIARYYLDNTYADACELLNSTGPLKGDYEWYATIIDHYGADLSELLEPGSRPQWWFHMPNIDSIKLVQKSLPVAYGDISPEQRLSKAFAVGLPTLSMFTTAAGYGADPGGLANVTAPDGQTALHFVANHFDFRGSDVDEYTTFVSALYDGGSNMHSLDQDGFTPLMWVILRHFSGVGPWLDMLHSAGVDLVRYGREELKVWKSTRGLRSTWEMERDRKLVMLNFTYGPSPRAWEPVVSCFLTLPIYASSLPPGAWINERAEGYRIRRICWEPSDCESIEEHWVHEQDKRIGFLGRTRTLPNTVLWPRRLKPLVRNNGPYDDATPIALMLMRPRKRYSSKRRGQSQPPAIRQLQHEQVCKNGFAVEDHTARFHMCKLKSPPRLHYNKYERDCLKGYYENYTRYFSDIRRGLQRWGRSNVGYSTYKKDYQDDPLDELTWDEYIVGRRAQY